MSYMYALYVCLICWHCHSLPSIRPSQRLRPRQVCMCIYVYICVYMCIYENVCVYMWYICVYMRMCMQCLRPRQACMCIYVCMSYMYALYVAVWRQACMCIYVCMPYMYALYVAVCRISMPYMSPSPPLYQEPPSENGEGDQSAECGQVLQRVPAGMPYMHALYACLICMPYMYALYACLICMPYMYALYVAVCRISMPYM